MILMDTSQEGSKSFCQRLIDQRNKSPMTALSHSFNVTFSLGFSLFPFIAEKPQWFSWNETLNLIDNCLYVEKHRGRNQAINITTDRQHATNEQKGILLKSIASEGYDFPASIKWETIKANTQI